MSQTERISAKMAEIKSLRADPYVRLAQRCSEEERRIDAQIADLRALRSLGKSLAAQGYLGGSAYEFGA